MYWTHHFSHLETLTRARRWLAQLGFTPDRMEVHTEGVPRMAFLVTPAQFAEVKMLINAVERSDPEGWPSFWELSAYAQHAPHSVAEPVPLEADSTEDSAIGWHPLD